MIENFNILKNSRGLTRFQSNTISLIINLLEEIDIDILHENSFVTESTRLVSVSILHKEDINTIVTLNIMPDQATLWYTSCELKFISDADLSQQNEMDIEKIRLIFEKCLRGKYYTEDYYYKRKLIFAITYLDGVKDCLTSFSIFRKWYVHRRSKNLRVERVSFLSFLKD